MPSLLSLKKIWDRAPHAAFTDLVMFQGRWLCTFREAESHAILPSTVRILASETGDRWESIACVAEPNVDLRDPKLSAMPDGRLLLVTGASTFTPEGRYLTRSPRVAFSPDGITWTAPEKVLAEDHWLWRVTWHDGVGYAVSKLGDGADPRRGFLYRTTDGRNWSWVTEFFLPGKSWTASETTLRVMPDGEMIGLIRPCWIGTSRPPYTDWKFTQIDAQLGGPNFIQAPDGTLWASSRHRHKSDNPVTVLARMTATSYEPVLTLPSGGDCSYPGMVWRDGILWMSYYSSHEGRASIYLAHISLEE